MSCIIENINEPVVYFKFENVTLWHVDIVIMRLFDIVTEIVKFEAAHIVSISESDNFTLRNADNSDTDIEY